MLQGVSVSVRNSLNFAGKTEKTEKSPAEEFVHAVETSVKAQEKGKFSSRFLWSPTAVYTSFLPLLGFEAYSIAKLSNLTKIGNAELKRNFVKKNIKHSLLFTLGAFVLCGALEYLFSRNSEKKFEKFQQDFVDINSETEAKLRNQIVRSSYIGAMCSSVSEEITFNQNLILDPISRRRLKKLVKHELVHAKQYEMIARSENGIKKLNYAVLKSAAKQYNNPDLEEAIEEIYQDIANDKTGKFDNVTLHLMGADVDLKRYIEGVHTLLTNKGAGIDDLPMVVDAEHYQEVIDKKGKLTPQEEEKAEKYYQAMLNYPELKFWSMFNPFSAYYDNILEKEAYKENPNFAIFIRKIFGKN